MRWCCLFTNTFLFFFAVLYFVFGDNKELAFWSGFLILVNTAALTELNPVVPLRCVSLYFYRRTLEEKARIAAIKKAS